MVRRTLNNDKPSFFRITSDLVDLEGDPVVGAPYSGAKGLISAAPQRGTHHDAAIEQLVADRKYRQPVLAGVRDPADTTASDEPQALRRAALIYASGPPDSIRCWSAGGPHHAASAAWIRSANAPESEYSAAQAT